MTGPAPARFAVFLLLLLATAAVSAQKDQGPARTDRLAVNLAAIQRSWDTQRQLAAIETDRARFIDTFLASWTLLVDNRVYDLDTELRPIMEEAAPWRLYGASLVGDFNTMVDVLRGKQSAGKLINAWSEPQPKVAPPEFPLGATTSQLVFTAIPPCRIVDTRNTGARTGILAIGVPRAFDLTTDGYTEGQGGQTFGCAGLPSFSHYAWAVNITAVGYPGTGGVKVYPFSGSEPATSIINYVPDGWAIANNGHVTGCYGCLDDITLVSFMSPTHVIVDVMGYYEMVPNAPVRTQMAGTATNVSAGDFVLVQGGACPGGTTLVGGTHFNTGFGQILTSDHGIDGSRWYEYVKSIATSTTFSVTVSSICLELP